MIPLSSLDRSQCQPHHDPTTLYISLFLCIGLVISYLPQHYRIIANKTSEGFSSWFLLLGVVSSTSSFLNIILLQWEAIACCASLSTGACLESLMGVFQIGLQWAMFSLVFVLYLLYFPEYRKRKANGAADTSDMPSGAHLPQGLHLDLPGPVSHAISDEWKVSLVIAMLCLAHLVVSVIVSVVLLFLVGGPVDSPLTNLWAGFLGILSMILAAMQYIPQIWKTWHRKSVGALSIPMMMLQTPGTALFVYSLIVRPGTNWTAWITYMVTGILQGTLLALCIVWHFRSKRLGLSDLDGSTVNEHTPLLRDNE
ncbi:hypothetical protein BC940DRAFT_270029 [Gongronella butleri]|nr:hypothetical protein BC940DRAFT_270029 [Gongronella butleri]